MDTITISLKDTKLRICGRATPFIIFKEGWLKEEDNRCELCATIFNYKESIAEIKKLLGIIEKTNLTNSIDLEIVHIFLAEKHILKSFELDSCSFGGPGSVKLELNGIYKVEDKIIQNIINVKEYDFSNLDLE